MPKWIRSCGRAILVSLLSQKLIKINEPAHLRREKKGLGHWVGRAVQFLLIKKKRNPHPVTPQLQIRFNPSLLINVLIKYILSICVRAPFPFWNTIFLFMYEIIKFVYLWLRPSWVESRRKRSSLLFCGHLVNEKFSSYPEHSSCLLLFLYFQF